MEQKYTIERYSRIKDCHILRDSTGKKVFVDLFTGSAFDMPPELKEKYDSISSHEESERFMQSLVGKMVTIENLDPYIPFYFGDNVKLIEV